MIDDKITPVDTRLPPAELERSKTRLIDAHEVLAMLELKNMLLAQQRQELIIVELRQVVDMLAAGQVATISEVERLRTSVTELEVQNIEMRGKQEKIVEMCDRLAESLSGFMDEK